MPAAAGGVSDVRLRRASESCGVVLLLRGHADVSGMHACVHRSFFDSIKRVAKKVQGALPVVGLVSRLASTEGGFDDLAYPEYSRFVINTSSREFQAALVELEKKYGKVGACGDVSIT